MGRSLEVCKACGAVLLKHVPRVSNVENGERIIVSCGLCPREEPHPADITFNDRKFLRSLRICWDET